MRNGACSLEADFDGIAVFLMRIEDVESNAGVFGKFLAVAGGGVGDNIEV